MPGDAGIPARACGELPRGAPRSRREVGGCGAARWREGCGAVADAFQERIRDHALLGRFGRLSCHAAPRRRELGLVAAAADRVLLPEPLLTHGANAEVQSVG